MLALVSHGRVHVCRVDPRVRFHFYEDFPGWGGAEEFFLRIVDTCQATKILEVGSGANPTFSGSLIADRGFRYITSDIARSELDRSPAGYEQRVIDLESGLLPGDILGQCDLIFSRMVNEHVRDGDKYHRSILRLLRPGGVAAHCYATMYTLPFCVNALIPDEVAERVLDFVAPRDRSQHHRFHAYYTWCRGPTRKMLRRFEGLGYDVVAYDGYYGHGYYQRRLGTLHRLEQVKARILVSHPLPILCSYATVVLRKPDDSNSRAEGKPVIGAGR